MISGSINVTGTVSATLILKRINLSTGATTDISNRLLSSTAVVRNGRIAPTAIVDVNSTDLGGDLELVVTVPLVGKLAVRVQARFVFQFSMNAPAVIVAGQAPPIIAIPPGGLTNFSGSYRFRDGVRSHYGLGAKDVGLPEADGEDGEATRWAASKLTPEMREQLCACCGSGKCSEPWACG